MRILIFKSVLILLLTFIVLDFTDQYFKNEALSSFFNNEYNSFNKNVDIAFFGSSHAQSSYDPRIFDCKLNINSYNFGDSAQRFITTLPVIKQALVKNNIKIGLVDIYKSSLDTILNIENSKTIQLKTLDKVGFSISKIKSFFSIFNLNEFYKFSPTIRNHSQWSKSFIKNDSFLTINHREFYRGFTTSKKKFTNSRWETYLKKVTKREIKLKKLSKVQEEQINQMINIFKDNNTQLVFVSAPSFNYFHDKSYKNWQEIIKEHLIKINADYIDLNEYWDELELSKDDFKDPNHLNANGAIKVSVFLSDFLNRKFKNIIKPKKDVSNRFTILKNNSQDILLNKTIKNPYLNDSIGIEKLYLHKVFDDFYELVVEGKEDSLKKVHLKITYKGDENEIKLNKNKSILFKDDKFIIHSVLKEGIDFNNKSYKTFRFYYPKKEIIDFKLFLGPKKNIKVLNINKLVL